MGFGALRSILRPVSRALLSARPTALYMPTHPLTSPLPTTDLRLLYGHQSFPWIPASTAFHSLTDTRFPKRRPSDKPRRKRASLRPPGPYAWVKYVPGEPIQANQPNEGSVKRRNEKKRMRLKMAFVMSEKRKRKAEMQEAKRNKKIKQVERKMAAVARDRAWAERLAELEEKKKAAEVTMS